jgi:hypothetical protein
MAGALATCIVMYLLTSHLAAFGESSYLINRIELASRGLRPYRDFEYAYGVSFLYIPLLLSRLLSISIPNAYYFFWVLNVIGGVWALSAVVNRIDYFSQRKNQIFALLYLSMVPGILTTGVNYTGFRFLMSPLLGVLVFRAIQNETLTNQIIGSLLAVVFAALLIAISPEMGIGFGLGMSVFLFLFYVRSRNKLWVFPYAGMLLLFSLLALIANRFQAFSMVRSMGNGGYNFPIVPAAHILLLFFSVFLAASYFVAQLRQGKIKSSTILVLLVSLPPLAACLGRCDPGHVLFDGIGIFLVTLLCASTFPRIWSWYRLSFVIVFVVFFAVSTILYYKEQIGRALIVFALRTEATCGSSFKLVDSITNRILIGKYGAAHAGEKLRGLNYVLRFDATSDSAQVFPQLHGIANSPFGNFFTHNATGYEGGYYFGMENVFDQAAVRSKIAELEQHASRELILIPFYDDACRVDPAASRVMISMLFLYPYRGIAVHASSIYRPLCDYISANYTLIVHPQLTTYGYSIWSRNKNLIPPPGS